MNNMNNAMGTLIRTLTGNSYSRTNLRKKLM